MDGLIHILVLIFEDMLHEKLFFWKWLCKIETCNVVWAQWWEHSGCTPPPPLTCSFILQHDCCKAFLEQEDEPEISNRKSSMLVLVALIFSAVFDTANPPAHIFSLLPPSFSSSLSCSPFPHLLLLLLPSLFKKRINFMPNFQLGIAVSLQRMRETEIQKFESRRVLYITLPLLILCEAFLPLREEMIGCK